VFTFGDTVRVEDRAVIAFFANQEPHHYKAIEAVTYELKLVQNPLKMKRVVMKTKTVTRTAERYYQEHNSGCRYY
jgi:hypothetical protein